MGSVPLKSSNYNMASNEMGSPAMGYEDYIMDSNSMNYNMDGIDAGRVALGPREYDNIKSGSNVMSPTGFQDYGDINNDMYSMYIDDNSGDYTNLNEPNYPVDQSLNQGKYYLRI